MRPGAILLAAAMLASGCGTDPGPAPDTGDHGYLLFTPSTQDAGWAVVDALDHELSSANKDKIRTAGLAGSGTRMFVDFTGSCTRDRDFVAAAGRIAAARGQATLECSATPPDQR